MDKLDRILAFIRKHERHKAKQRFVVSYLDSGHVIMELNSGIFHIKCLVDFSLLAGSTNWRSLICSEVIHMRSSIYEHGCIDVQSMSRYKPTLDFITQAHGDQRRRFTGLPYVTHPISAANLFIYSNRKMQLCDKPFTGDVDSIVNAILCHDVVEDTKFSVADVAAVTSHHVSNMVRMLTKNDTYNDQLAEASDYVKIAKLCDIRDNVKDFLTHSANPAYLEAKLRQVNRIEVDHYIYYSTKLLLELLLLIPKMKLHFKEMGDAHLSMLGNLHALIEMADDLAVSDFLNTARFWIHSTDTSWLMSISRATFRMKHLATWKKYVNDAVAESRLLLPEDKVRSLFKGLV